MDQLISSSERSNTQDFFPTDVDLSSEATSTDEASREQWSAAKEAFFRQSALRQLANQDRTSVSVPLPVPGTLSEVFSDRVVQLAMKARTAARDRGAVLASVQVPNKPGTFHHFSPYMHNIILNLGHTPDSTNAEEISKFQQERRLWSMYFEYERKELNGAGLPMLLSARSCVEGNATELSGSLWSLSLLMKTLPNSRIMCVTDMDMPLSSFQSGPLCEVVVQKTEELLRKALKRINGAKQIDEHHNKLDVGPDFAKLRELHVLESDTRYILDIMLEPLLAACGVTLRTELLYSAKETDRGRGLATSRLDYVMYRKQNNGDGTSPKLVGAIEAKRSGGNLNQALVQVVAQLLTIAPKHHEAHENLVDKSYPLVGIVTDAERFSAVVLDANHLYLLVDSTFTLSSWDNAANAMRYLFMLLHPKFGKSFFETSQRLCNSTENSERAIFNSPKVLKIPSQIDPLRSPSHDVYKSPRKSHVTPASVNETIDSQVELVSAPINEKENAKGQSDSVDQRAVKKIRLSDDCEPMNTSIADSNVACTSEQNDSNNFECASRIEYSSCQSDVPKCDTEVDSRVNEDLVEWTTCATAPANSVNTINIRKQANWYVRGKLQLSFKDEYTATTGWSITKLTQVLKKELSQDSFMAGCLLEATGSYLAVWCEAFRFTLIKQHLGNIVNSETGHSFPSEQMVWICQ